MSQHSLEGDFKGPIPPLLSSRIGIQDGDFQAQSSSSLNAHSPRLVFGSQTNINKHSNVLSASIEIECPASLKPNFMKLIVAKSIQNNFIKNLINRSYVRQLHQLTQYQISQLDDLQFSIETAEVNKNYQIFGFIDVFTPQSKFLIFWSLFQIITYLVIFFWLPFKISFEIYHLSQLYTEQESLTVEIILMAILAFDIAIGMNIAFIDKGQLIKDRQKVIMNYFQKNAFVDLFFVPNLSSKSFEMIILQVGFCLIFYFLRVTKINNMLAQLQEFFNLSELMNDLVNLMKVLLVIISVVHNFGCLWHGIAHFNPSFTWLDAYNFRDRQIGSKYNVAIYWATMTMTTVGYGDITAKNDLELLINNLTMFIGSIVFAYSVNSIGILVTNIYKNSQEYSKTVSLINKFMVKNRIEFDLQTKIRSYLEYIWKEEQEQNDDQVGDVISKLSKQLQEELQFQLRGNILRKCKIMVNTFSESLIKNLLQLMEEQSFSPDERIISVNELDDCALYIITKGEVELIFEGVEMKDRVKRNTFKNYSQCDSFGEFSFFSGNPRTATAISRGFTRVFKIKRQVFLDLLKHHPNDQEKYFVIRESLRFGDYSPLKQQCFSCQSKSHMIVDCNYVHFCVDKDRVIKQETYPIQQERTNRCQRFTQKYNARNNLSTIQAKAANYINDVSFTMTQDYESPTQVMHDIFEDAEIGQNQNIASLADIKPSTASIKDDDQQQQQQQSMISFKNNLSKSAIQTFSLAGFGNKPNQKKKFLKEEEISDESKNQLEPAHSRPNIMSVKQPRQSVMTQKGTTHATDARNYRPSIDLKMMGNPHQSDLNIKSPSNNAKSIEPSPQGPQIHQNNATVITNITQHNIPSSTLWVNQVLLGFEKMQSFQSYHPKYNYDQVLKRYAKLQKFFGKKRLLPEFSAYSFFHEAISKGAKLRRFGELQKVKRSPRLANFNVFKRTFKSSFAFGRQTGKDMN
ncbi:unnamed protein product [Paramecium octaurelia]|uniref:Cyclic nucleotide-binding domain-containing protein n=1 Tax=Paramecium octaurelia TaxID=43137 RepID=A0A8S1U4T0_PAROT|nr:unnamed protein product [Paramecium octaurelia]